MLSHPLTTTAALRAAGVSARDLLAGEAAGEIIRPIRGVAVTPEVYADPRLDDALVCSRTGGVIGLLTAAARHGLCDAVPPAIQVIAPWADQVRPPAGLPVQLFRTRAADALQVGVDVEDFHGLQIRQTMPARTVVDLYRLHPDANRQHAVVALARYVAEGHPIDDLHRIADTFGCWGTLRPEVEIALEARGGMRP